VSTDRLIVALDLPDLASVDTALARLGAATRFYKVGLELFTACGPAAVERVVRHGARVFLDLKICDIPATARGAVRSAASLGADFTTVHALGGRAMIAAAREASDSAPHGPKILAVTLLTSLGDEDLGALGVAGPSESAVLRLGRMAIAAGANGLVASPREVAALRQAVGPGPLLVIPGVRPAGAAADDQRRTLTAGEAMAAGADHIVVGRPILQSPDPAAAARAILSEIGA
jgi:orotidine-5'-phosphate decarboxylase